MMQYTVTFSVQHLKTIALNVLKFWVEQDKKLAEKRRTLGPRPKDEKTYTSEWSTMERQEKYLDERIFESKIFIASLEHCKEEEFTFTANDLRWLYPDLSLEDSDTLK